VTAALHALTFHAITRYISQNKDLVMEYFELIKAASMDEGLSVRKRAMKVRNLCREND
jgi:prephenate dehydrogenase